MSLVRRSVLMCVLLLAWALLAPRASAAQAWCASQSKGWAPVSYQELTLDNLTAQRIDVSGLAASATNIAMALVTVEGATLRFRFAGAPTGDSGHELAPGSNFFICGRLLIAEFQAIRSTVGAQNALVRISLFQPF